MEVNIITNEGRVYLQLQASGATQEQARFDIYVIDESMAKNSDGVQLADSYMAYAPTSTVFPGGAHYQLQDN